MDKLISLLYEDSSLSAEELSAMLGESEESIEKRIAEYKKNGVILGKKIFINWDKVEESGVTALIELKVTLASEIIKTPAINSSIVKACLMFKSLIKASPLTNIL